MFRTVKEDFRKLRQGRPGRRFQDFHRFRRENRGQSWVHSRFFTLSLSVALIGGGLAIGWLPGPGGFIALFGIALLAAESRVVARLLDWGEPRFHRLWGPFHRWWRRLSPTHRTLLGVGAAMAGAVVIYLGYELMMK